MSWLTDLNWQTTNWITPGIHVYAVMVFILTITVFVVHHSRLLDMLRRLASISHQIEGSGLDASRVRLDQMTSLMLHLGDVVERRGDLDIGPILDFVRKEERMRGLSVVNTLVNLTETMIELFPILGILGTVWGISGVGQENFTSERLLFLFAAATSTTLWALLYAVVFRIAYSAFVQSKVVALQDYYVRFQEFLGVLEKRVSSADFGIEAATNPWSEKSG